MQNAIGMAYRYQVQVLKQVHEQTLDRGNGTARVLAAPSPRRGRGIAC